MLSNKNENLLLNDRWLRLAEFWANNRERFRKTILAVVIVVEATLLLYSGWLLFDMFVLNAQRDAKVIQQLGVFPDYTRLHPLISPDPLPPPVAVVLAESASNGMYDVLLRFSNPNPDWYVDVYYESGQQTGMARVLNNQERLVVLPGVANSLSGLPTITVTNTRWKRIKNLDEFVRRTPDLIIDNVQYSVSGNEPGRVGFTLTNDSIFNFWEVSATVALLQGDRAIAARQVQLNELLSGEEREVGVNFFGGVGSVTDVLVVPFVDVANDGVFMNLETPASKF
jgi:hypothetical protein